MQKELTFDDTNTPITPPPLFPDGGRPTNTEIFLILDRSGSMQSLVSDSIGGINEFIKKQKALPGNARVTMVLFDNIIEETYSVLPLQEFPEVTSSTYFVRGSTAMYDAIGQTLNKHAARIANEKWADSVVVCILTDGYDNMSKEYNSIQVADLISKYQKQDWDFVFLAANQDALASAKNVGLGNYVKAANFKPGGIGGQSISAAYSATMSDYTTSLRSVAKAAPTWATMQADVSSNKDGSAKLETLSDKLVDSISPL